MAFNHAMSQEPVRNLDGVVRLIDDISTLPQVAVLVMRIANDPNSGVGDLKRVLESDASLSARVLRCVNSAVYAVRTKITNLQQAITYLGMKQIRNLAMTACVNELFCENEKIGDYQRADLWRHLVAVGVCARLIALRRNITAFEDAFLAGLLHDVGIILEDQYEHAGFARVMESLDKTKTLAEVERSVLGYDHTMLGEKVSALWGFPEVVRGTIRYHHMSGNYRGEHVDIVRCVEVANLICTVKGITSVGRKLVRNAPPALAALSLTGPDLAVLSEDLDQEITKNASLFAL